MVDHLNEGIVMQSRDDIVLACNRSARRLLRMSEVAIGRSIMSVIGRVLDENGAPLPNSMRPSMRAL